MAQGTFGAMHIVYRRGNYIVTIRPSRERERFVRAEVWRADESGEPHTPVMERGLRFVQWCTTIEPHDSPWWKPFERSYPGLRHVLADACAYADAEARREEDEAARATDTMEAVEQDGDNFIDAMREVELLDA